MKKLLFLSLVALGGIGLWASVSNPQKKPVQPVVQKEAPMIPKVYFTRDISPAGLLKLYNKVNENITGKVVIKFHTGEPHGPNLLPKDMVKALVDTVPGSVLADTNVYYDSPRQTTKGHRETIHTNGWDAFATVDILDEDGTVMLPIKGGKRFKEMSMGSHLLNYDSMIVLTHFKGHTMGGFGGSIKNIAIGCADGKVGKKMIHTAPGQGQWSISKTPFMENMVESAKATVDHFAPHITFINVLRRMSVDCDCAGVAAAEPTIHDIGILASTNILAIDQASIDLVYQAPPEELHDIKERIESREGLHQLEYGAEMGLGSRQYELVNVD